MKRIVFWQVRVTQHNLVKFYRCIEGKRFFRNVSHTLYRYVRDNGTLHGHVRENFE
jgi:hypothetical protein